MSANTPYNYGGLAPEYSDYDRAQIVIQPVPYDKSSTWGKGADKGPDAIIDASRNMELYDIDTDSEVYTKGIFTAKEIDAASGSELAAKTAKAVAEFLADGKFVVSVGGEHSVSLGPIAAHAKRYGNMSVLHLDAHSDRRDSYEGDTHSHASIIARAQEHVKKIVSVGVRSMDASEKENVKKDKIIYASEVYSSPNWIKKALAGLSRHVYITIDLDVFDSSVMPSTGTPEPGGLNWYQVINLIKAVAKNKKILGLDVVELAPTPYDRAPDFLAAKLIYCILSLVFAKK